jgi:hypothetical protein
MTHVTFPCGSRSLSPRGCTPFRQDPRFHAFAERLNLVEYWKVYGPPDGCALEKGKIACR